MSSSSPERLVTFDITLCGIDELVALRDRGVTHILSLLDPGWPAPSAFSDLGGPNRLDLRFHDIIDPGDGWRAAEGEDIDRLLAFGRLLPVTGGHLVVHCQMGISRSSAAVFLLLAQARPDRQADELLAEVVRIRPHAWPNLRIVELGDARLDRGGALVEAAHRRYREVVAKRPEIGRAMLQMGRKREVERILSVD
ncbi:MAG: tyrosine phosphatase family protein [Stellaceae bacterium]